MTLKSETDRPLENASADEFGFIEMAKKLAPSLADATVSDGMVIGIEGQWGSGKTSLLNFLQQELAKLNRERFHVITLAPWLTGDAGNLVSALTNAIADILEAEEQKPSGWLRNSKKKAGGYAKILRDYGSRTGRTLAPLAKIAGVFYPPAAVIGEGLGQGAEYLEKLGRSPTDAEVKRAISAKLKEFDNHFLVFIDDLDRLEPSQAVEVIRLVRSVADFPKVAYVMCYDRTILAHALEIGLQVENGDLFLQKVVQLTFSIPLPEPFDLRISLRNKAFAVYREVTGRDPEPDEADDIRNAIDQQGAGLRTPREIKLVMNAIKFAFANMADEVNFADLCRISLIKILNPPLYRWLENYLSVHSVISTGDATVPEDDIEDMGNELGVILPSSEASSTRSIWSITGFIPGVQQDETPSKRVFQNEYSKTITDYINRKRLGSPRHYRNYFALSTPRTVLSDEKIQELLQLAGADPAALCVKLIEYINAPRQVGKSWFEHILERFDTDYVRQLSTERLSGLAIAISNVMDIDVATNSQVRVFAHSSSDKGRMVVRDIVQTVRNRNADEAKRLLNTIFNNGSALGWLVSELFRTELFSHGRVGNQQRGDEKRVVTGDELDEYTTILSNRLHQAAEKGTLASVPNLSGLLFGWRDMSGDEAPKAWVADYVTSDGNLLSFLLEMRGLSVSDKVYRPLNKRTVEFFYDWDAAMSQMDAIKAGAPSVDDLKRITLIENSIRDAEGRDRD
ncbi:KAP family P-loop NTPase fold protein [Agrobacterium cavarae]|uniref:KAP family P-loop NTPase fold protein n=1 Tax=Agrobacterium cavarae TaxID=2528239 RepID=UPI003FD09DCF